MECFQRRKLLRFSFILTTWSTCRTLQDYAKWHVILNAVQYTGGDLAINDVLRKSRFPKSSQLGDDRSMDCVEFVEMAMPFALARPFVDKYITDDVRTKVSGALIRMYYSYHSYLLSANYRIKYHIRSTLQLMLFRMLS